MSIDRETVTADQLTTFPRTRDEARRAWEVFLPRVPAYDADFAIRHRKINR